MALSDYIAYSVARIPIRAYRASKPSVQRRAFYEIQDATTHGRKAQVIRDMLRTKEVEEVDHPALRLIHQPMGHDRFDMLDGLQWRVVAQQMLELSGNAFVLFEGNGGSGGALRGPPTEMLPIPDAWVQKRPNGKFDITSTEESIEWLDIHASRLHWIRRPRPANPFGRGIGVAQVLSDEIDTDEAAAVFMSSILQHHGVPALLVQVEDSTPEQRMQMAIDLNNRFRGPKKAGQTLVTAGKIDVKDVGQSPSDLDLVALQEGMWKRARETLGIPPEELGVVEDSNRATIREAGRIAGKNVIEPRCALWDGYYTNRLVRLWPDGENIIIAHDSAIPTDDESETKARETAPFALSIDEWRARCGEQPRGDEIGKMHVIDGVPMSPESFAELAKNTIEGAKPQPKAEPAANGGSKPKPKV